MAESPVRPSTATGSDQQLSYEEARAALAEVLRRMETGGVSLEECLALWEEGERLAEICRTWLAGAQARLDAAVEPESE